MEPALRLQRITKAFGATRAVDGIDLEVPRGSTYGFIGPSGAGKTTCIRMIMSILFPDSGELSVLGRPSALEAKDRIGYLPEERGVYRRMKVGEFVNYIGQLKGVDEDEVGARTSKLLARAGLDGIEQKRCEDLSKGMVHRVEFVAAIINQPDLLILDEPFSGLDPVSVRLLKEMVEDEQRRGVTILFSTHIMAHAEELCDHVVMIHKGRKVLDEAMSGLKRQYDPRVVRVEPLDPALPVASLRGVPGVVDVQPTDEGYEIRLLEGADPASAIRHITATVPVARVELARLRLEDVFIRLVAGDGQTADAERALRANLQGMVAGGVHA